MSHVMDCLCVPGQKCTLRVANACTKHPTPEVLAIIAQAMDDPEFRYEEWRYVDQMQHEHAIENGLYPVREDDD